MGNQSLVVCLGQSRDLTKTCDAVGHHNVWLNDAVDILFEHPPVFVYAAIVLSTGDGNAYKAAQLGQFIERVAQPRFFQPETVQTLEFPRGLQRAAKVPHHTRLPRAKGLCLVGVHHDLHVVAHCFAHRFDQLHVFLQRGVVCPQLDRLPTLRFELERHASPFLRSGKLDHARIGRHLVLGRTPDFVKRLARGFADQVPQRNLKSRNCARASAHVVAQRAGQLLNIEWVLADQLRLGRLQKTGVHPRPDSRESLVGLDLDDRPAADPLRRHRSWIPRRFHLAGFAHHLQVHDADVGNFEPHRSVQLRHQSGKRC